jgi:outer membrane protein OmpA-like peptidoglycan-associated protein
MKKSVIKTIFLLILCATLHAQTADEIQTLLKTPAVSYAQAARFVLEAADVTGSYDKANGQDAMRFAIEKNWLPKNANAQDAISLEGLSLLIMKSFNLKGGPMYTWLNNAHYSYREMVFQDLIQGRSDPHMNVSGEKMLFIVNRLLYRIEDNPWEFSREVTAEKITAQIKAMGIANTDVRITEEGVTISISNIQFLANSSELPDKEKGEIAEIARILMSIPGRKILVTGHTALAGTEQERLLTSRERAQSVADYLVSLGARKTNEIVVRGYGSEKPIADNSTPEGMALNRRVEITLLEDVQ